MDPPPSEPKLRFAIPAAQRVAAPPELPPLVNKVFLTFLVTPKAMELVVALNPISGVVVEQSNIAPARNIKSMWACDSSGISATSGIALPFVSLTPRHLLEVMSFTVNRIPSKALNGVPSLYRSVDAAAASIACWSRNTATAFNWELTAFNLVNCFFVNCKGVVVPALYLLTRSDSDTDQSDLGSYNRAHRDIHWQGNNKRKPKLCMLSRQKDVSVFELLLNEKFSDLSPALDEQRVFVRVFSAFLISIGSPRWPFPRFSQYYWRTNGHETEIIQEHNATTSPHKGNTTNIIQSNRPPNIG